MMDLQPWLWLAGAAVLAFWLLGAHNRLVTLRNAIGGAWAQFDAPLQRRSGAIEPLVAALRALLPEERGTLEAVATAQSQVRAAADALRQRPALGRRAVALAQAEAALSAALARLQALVENHPQLHAHADVSPHVAVLGEAAPRLAFARQLFNDAAQAYNAAVAQFPTSVVARLFGFGAAGAL